MIEDNRLLFLHIGITKTGSTYLQNYFNFNREILRQHGIAFPPITFEGNSSKTPGHHFILRDIERLKAALADFDDCHTFVLSSEMLSIDLSQGKKLEILDYLLQNFRLKIVIYLRRQDEWIESHYKEHVCGGGHKYTRDIQSFISEQKIQNLNYEEFLEAVECRVNIDNILLGIYDRKALKGKSIISDFANLCEMEYLLPLCQSPGSAVGNNSPDLRTVLLIREFNKLPMSREQYREWLYPAIAEFEKNGSENHVEGKEVLPKYLEQNILNAYSASNEYVARRYFGKPILFSEASSSNRIPLNFNPPSYSIKEIRLLINAIAAIYKNDYSSTKETAISKNSKLNRIDIGGAKKLSGKINRAIKNFLQK